MRAGDVLRAIPMSEWIFTNEDLEYYNKITGKELLLQGLQASYLLSSSYMMWMLVALVCNSSAPVVVVLSESMHPGFNRGDILLLANRRSEYYSGDICVFELSKGEIPIVHRVVEKRYSKKELVPTENPNSTKYPNANHFEYMTKGDNNQVNDAFLYRQAGCSYINRKHLNNIVYAAVPLVGMVTIWAGTWAGLKYIVIGILFMDVVFTRDNTVGVIKADETADEAEKDREKKKKKS
ncbi:signal peptidase I [Nematocida major]|uniref:signal peptidase I n=1 Tax=Nematocida major TaxID=1912982 RepID=UPI0020083A1C|nr:signal peptidase I [Nematocida major]KAH9386465.1 signal peptidase I [Nematocida major]